MKSLDQSWFNLMPLCESDNVCALQKKWCFLSYVTINFDSQISHSVKHEWYVPLLNITKETRSFTSSDGRYFSICETYQSVRSKNKHTEFVLTTFAVVHSCFTFMNLLSPLSPPSFLLSLLSPPSPPPPFFLTTFFLFNFFPLPQWEEESLRL